MLKMAKEEFRRQDAQKEKGGLSVQGDCLWDQRKGQRAYNWDSGTQLLVVAYFLHMYQTGPWEKFCHMSNAVIEQHFNNHEYCKDWCPVFK
jgi:hypothetical protein